VRRRSVFAIQDEITFVLATEMRVKLTEGEQARLHHTTTKNVEAWNHWVQGLSYYRGPATRHRGGVKTRRTAPRCADAPGLPWIGLSSTTHANSGSLPPRVFEAATKLRSIGGGRSVLPIAPEVDCFLCDWQERRLRSCNVQFDAVWLRGIFLR
jgi:hypothetical protein